MPSPIIMAIGVCSALVAIIMYCEFRKRHPEPGVVREAIIDIAAWCQTTHQISTAVYRTAFALIWGGTCYLSWMWVASFWLIEPGHTIQPVRGVGNDLAISLICIGGPLCIAWLTWHGFTKLFTHISHKKLREQVEELQAIRHDSDSRRETEAQRDWQAVD